MTRISDLEVNFGLKNSWHKLKPKLYLNLQFYLNQCKLACTFSVLQRIHQQQGWGGEKETVQCPFWVSVRHA